MDNYLCYVINVRDRKSGELEAQIQVTRDEAAMPGYVDHIRKGYVAAGVWVTDLVEVAPVNA